MALVWPNKITAEMVQDYTLRHRLAWQINDSIGMIRFQRNLTAIKATVEYFSRRILTAALKKAAVSPPHNF